MRPLPRKEERATRYRVFVDRLLVDFTASPRWLRDRINGEVARRMRGFSGPAEERDATRQRVLVNVLKRERATGRLRAPRHSNPPPVAYRDAAD